MLQPPHVELIATLDGLQKGQHLALFWGAPDLRRAVLVYLRVSSKMQLEGAGLRDQWETCVAHAARLGWHIAGLYTDPAISGRKDSRPAIDQLRNDVRRNRIPRVLFYRVNRMGRNAPAMWAAADELERSGAEVVSATEHFDRSTAAGKLTFNMLASFAQFGSDQLSEVMQNRLSSKGREGNWVGPLPFGYDRAGRTLAFSRLAAPTAPLASHVLFAPYAHDYGISLADPVTNALAVRVLHEQYNTDRFSYTTLAELFNDLGLRTLDWQTQRWGIWGRESVRTMLQNRVYAGYVTVRGEAHRGNHPPIINEALWDANQRRMAARTVTRIVTNTPAGQPRIPSFCYCAACGSKYHRHITGKTATRITRYRCGGVRSTDAQAQRCQAAMIREDYIANTLRLLLQEFRITPELQAAIDAEARTACALPPLDLRPQMDRQKSLRVLKQQFLDEEISAAAYEAEKRIIETAPPAPQARPDVPDLALVLALLRDVPALAHAANDEEFYALVGPMFSHVWVRDQQIAAVTPTAPFAPALIALAQTGRGEGQEVGKGCPKGFYLPAQPQLIALVRSDRTPIRVAA